MVQLLMASNGGQKGAVGSRAPRGSGFGQSARAADRRAASTDRLLDSKADPSPVRRQPAESPSKMKFICGDGVQWPLLTCRRCIGLRLSTQDPGFRRSSANSGGSDRENHVRQRKPALRG